MGGAEKVEDFYRLFLAPGMGHCAGGPGPTLVDYPTAMENWVENGFAPSCLCVLVAIRLRRISKNAKNSQLIA